MALLTCHECGGKVSSEAAQCPHCGAKVKNEQTDIVESKTVANATTTQSKPDDWLAWSILSTLLCCLPLGLVGIVYASKVDSAWYAGRYDEALAAADKARTITLISAGAGISVSILYVIAILAGLI